MRISHRELEACLQNPYRWVSTKLNPSAGGARGSYDQCLREGIYYFHKYGDAAEGRRKISALLTSYKLQNLLRVERTLQSFDAYLNWYYGSGLTVADQRVRIESNLGEGLILGGIIPRIDMLTDGYRAVLLGPAPAAWKQELRMPLIQRVVAKTYGRAEEQFSVAYQKLDGTDIQEALYSSTELNEADDTARRLASTVMTEAKKYPLLVK